MHKVILVGVDPGLKGAWATIKNPQLSKFKVEDCGEIRNVQLLSQDLSVIQNALSLCVKESERVLVIIEDQWPRPGAAASSSRTLMLNFGRLVRSVEISGADYMFVHPTFWKRDMDVSKDKGSSISQAEKLWPEVNLVPPRGRVKHDGLAEAILIAEWGRMLVSC